MNQEETFATIERLIKKITGNEGVSVTPETRFEDIEEWDSLNTVDLEMELESEFGISFEVGEFQEIKDIKTLTETLASKTK